MRCVVVPFRAVSHTLQQLDDVDIFALNTPFRNSNKFRVIR